MKVATRRWGTVNIESRKTASVRHVANSGVEVSFSVHGSVTVMVGVPEEWFDADGALLPQYEQQVDQLAQKKLGDLMHQVPDAFNIQIEPV